MKSRLLSLCAFGICCVGLAIAADDPKPDEGEPPVRLKKKKKPDVQPDQPKDDKDKDDKAKDDKAKDDKAKDEMPKDVEVGPGAKEDEKEVLDRISRNMKSLEDRFVNKELDEGARQLKDDIIKDIDSLIKMAENPPPSGSSGGSGSEGTGGTSSRSGNSGGQPDSQPMDKIGMNPMKGGSEGSKQGEGTRGAGLTSDNNPPKPPNGEDERGKWGHLPESLRASMSAFSSREDYMQKHQELIREYYRNLAKQGGK
jgi:hypothetical protein